MYEGKVHWLSAQVVGTALQDGGRLGVASVATVSGRKLKNLARNRVLQCKLERWIL
jgi:hypothetical protein